MSVVFKSNCAWRFVSGRRSGKAKGLPARTDTWHGRYDQLDTFLDSYPVGALYAGGYIIDRDVRDTAPKSEVDLVLALPPDFNAYSAAPSVANKVFQKSGAVTDDDHTLFPDEPYPTSIEAARTISARVHATTYRYFSSNLPISARFYTEVTGQNPKILSDQIVVTAKDGAGKDTPLTYSSYASAPANVRSAIDIEIVASVESSQGTPIDGTPWYECQDEVIKGYET